ncbi:MAG: hypothetical protein K6E73_09305 [Bacteroidales bacterium]|nr:hypothetical protein [Bacteroidales bacterium]
MNKTIITAMLLGMAMCADTAWADSDVTAEKSEQNTPKGWPTVQLPNIAAITSDNTFSIEDYGASTSAVDNASAINQAITAANSAGGGMVVIPAGTWLSGPITMKSNVVFHISAGATVKLLPFAGVNVVPTAGDGKYPVESGSSGSYNYVGFMTNGGETISNVIVEGEGTTSIIDGQGAAWWTNYKSIGTRPCLIRLGKGSAFLFRNFKMVNSPGTNLTLGQSGNAKHFTVHDVTISAPSSSASNPSHNTDGIPVWGPYVNIYNCNISTGDDNVVFDSNSQYGHVWNCTFGDGHGASMGSYTANVHDLLWEDITFKGTGAGFRLKSNYDRSGNVYNITMQNCTMTGVQDPIYITMWYDTHPTPGDATCLADTITPYTMEFHDIKFKNITSIGTAYNSSVKHYFPVFILGRPNSKVHDVTFDNVQISAAKGMFLAYCEGITFKNSCNIKNTQSSATRVQSTSYDYSFVGNIDGTANADYDGEDEEEEEIDDSGVTGTFFSMTDFTTENVSLDAGTDLDLANYATITGGSATLHNGHADKTATMLKSGGFYVGNSGGSYLKVTLDTPLKEGDVLTTTGGDGGLVDVAASKDATDNIAGNKFTFTSQFAGMSTFCISRGSTKPTITSLSITRQSSDTGISQTVDNETTAIDAIYTLQGIRIGTLQSGFNIVRSNAGTAKKLIVR